MLGSYLYWISAAALVLCVYLSFMRRQNVRELAETRKKLLDERQEREQIRAELVHVRNTSEKDLAAAKKQASEAKSARAELEEEKKKAVAELDEVRSELESAYVDLADRTDSEESAKAKVAQLEKRLAAGQTGVAAVETRLSDLTSELKSALFEVGSLQKKLEAEARLRKAAEDERGSAKATVATLEGKLREAERAKTALDKAQADASKAQADVSKARTAALTLEADLASAKERLAKAEAELAAERSKVQTPVPSGVSIAVGAGGAGGAGGGDLLAALESDPYLNRGQKETIRMTYNQFTAKKRSSSGQ